MIRTEKIQIPEDVISAKRWWRTNLKRIMASLTDSYRNDASNSIREKLCHMDEYKNAETIMLYSSLGKEVITNGMLNMAYRHGKKLCLPRCTEEKGVMEARVFGEGHKLVSGHYGILEPDVEAELVDAKDIDLIVLPCLGCDVSCVRIGHGAGYYDRFLEGVREDCCLVAVCYEELLAEKLPLEAHDVRVDRVITEDNIYCKL